VKQRPAVTTSMYAIYNIFTAIVSLMCIGVSRRSGFELVNVS